MAPASLLCLLMWQWAELAEVSAARVAAARAAAAIVVVERSVVAMDGAARGQAA